MFKSKLGLAVACGVLSMGFTSASFAQEQPAQPGQPGQGRGGDRGGRGNFDPAAFREQANQRMRERLGASEEEWKVLQPRIEKVQTAQRNYNSRGGGFGGFGGGPGGPGGGRTRGPGGGEGGPAGGGTTQPESPVAKAASELRAITENKEAPAADVKAKLDAYRAAKAKAKDELAAAQKELTELITPKQEAILVSMGTLD